MSLVGSGIRVSTDSAGNVTGVSFTHNGTGSLEVQTNPDGTTSPTRITIDGQSFTENCGTADANDYYCTNSAVNGEGAITKLGNGYNYLHVMSWDKLPDYTPKALFVGGREADRTPSNVPISGSYSGFAKIGGTFDREYKGNVALTIQNGTVSGSISQFTDDDTDANVGGTVSINGQVTGNTMEANISGTFDTHTIQRGQMNGAFFGPNGEEVGGGIAGTTTNGDAFGGGWIAKKQ